MNRSKRSLLVVSLLALALVAASCGGDDGTDGKQGDLKPGGIFRVQTDAFEWTGGLDPTGEYLGWAFEFFSAIHRTLVGYNHKPGAQGGNDIIADAATNTGDVSADGLTWTFKIKPGVKFSPPLNRDVTSKDYANAFKRLANSTFNATGYPSYYLGTIAGMQEVADGKATEISGITTPDNSTIVFKLTRPTGDFGYRLAMPAAAPMPEEVTKCMTKGKEYGRYQIASGPYMIEGTDKLDVSSCANLLKSPASGFNPETHLKIVRNPTYDAKTDNKEARSNYVDGVELTKNTNVDDIFNKIESGQVDGESANPPPAFIQKGLQKGGPFEDNFRVDSGDRTWYISLNLALPPFDDVAVRKAANQVMDKEGLVRVRGGEAAGIPAEHIVPPDVLGGRLKVGEFDPYKSANYAGDEAKAKTFMKESKYDTNKDGTCDAPQCKNVLFITRSTQIYKDMAPIVQNSLAKIGITLTVRPVESFYSTVQVTSQTPPIAGGAGWGKDYADASTFFEPLLSSAAIKKDATQNYSLLGITAAQAAESSLRLPSGGVPSADQDIAACSVKLGEDRANCWAELDKKMMNEYLPWIPYLWATNISVISDAVLNYTYDQFAGEVSFVHIAIDPTKQKTA